MAPADLTCTIFFPTAGHEGSEEQKEQSKPKCFQSAFSALFSQEQLRLHLQPYEAFITSLKDLIITQIE